MSEYLPQSSIRWDRRCPQITFTIRGRWWRIYAGVTFKTKRLRWRKFYGHRLLALRLRRDRTVGIQTCRRDRAEQEG